MVIVLLSVGFLAGTFLYWNNPFKRFFPKGEQVMVPIEQSVDRGTSIKNNTPDIIEENTNIPAADLPPDIVRVAWTNVSPNDIQVAWREPKRLADLSLLHEEDYYEPEYYEVGTFLEGKYKGGVLIIVLANPNTMSFGGDIFRFVKQENTYTLLWKASSEMFDNDYPPDPNKKNLFYQQDDEYKIHTLAFPETINGSKKGQVLYFIKYVHGLFDFPQDELQQVFVDPVLGTVYTDSSKAENPQYGFYIQAADGTYVEYIIQTPFSGEDGVQHITWNDGTNNTAEYSMTDMTSCGSRNYASVVTSSGLTWGKGIPLNSDNDLVAIGKASNGDIILGLKDPNHPAFKWIYENLYLYGDNGTKDDYEAFVSQYPLFFWKDPFDRLIIFKNSKFLPQAECAKPVIYLYPGQETRVSVKLYPQGGFTVTEPLYKDGWNVIAQPDGTLTEMSTEKQYPYLFWEGRGGLYKKPNQGFMVKRENVEKFLTGHLAQLGLNGQETADFLEYWLPYMQKAPYYFIGFYGNRVMDEIAPLAITPKPDTIIRILMDFTPLEKPVQVTPPPLTITPQRKGFTVVEWGGVK